MARSLKLLDLVIGEFDDGLESEIEKGDETQIQRKVRQKPNSAINKKIDHIFNELTQEIYVEQKKEQRQKSPTRNVFDPLPAPPKGRWEERKGRGGREQEERGGREQGGKAGIEQRERGGRDQRERERRNSGDNTRPPPGTVIAAKQSYLKRAKSPEGRAEVVLYPGFNFGRDNQPGTHEKVKVDVHSFASETSVSVKAKSPPVAAIAGKEKAVIKELREKVEGKQGKISKFSHDNSDGDGREERR